MTIAHQFESERLVIRPLALDDYARWKNAYQNLKPPQNAFDDVPVKASWISKQRFLAWLASDQDDIARDFAYHFIALTKQSQIMIGTSQIWGIQRGHCQRATLGFSVMNNHWRQGFGFELAQATVYYGLNNLNLNRIEAEILPENLVSIRLCQKLGMQPEGRRRSALYENNAWRDHLIYAITAQDIGLNERHGKYTC